MTNAPIEFDDDDVIDVESAPVVDAEATAMAVIIARTGRRVGWLGRLLIASLTGLLALTIWTLSWNFLNGIVASNPLLGKVAIGLFAITVVITIIYLVREFSALLRLRAVDSLRDRGVEIRNGGSFDASLLHAAKLERFYRGNPNILHEKFEQNVAALSDAGSVLDYSENQLMQPLDALARAEIERRARQVAVVTAFVPLALADLLVVLNANVGMIRNIADIYGGRPGWLGGWRLTRRVIGHLVATGAVAVGDDVIGSVMGGNILGKLSRRFGEGIINAALTARVGVAAIEVCRPMVFYAEKEPSVSGMIATALKGFVATKSKA